MRVLETSEIGQVSGAGLLGLNLGLGLGINVLGILGIGVAAGVDVDAGGNGKSCNDDRGHDSHNNHGCR
jgi:hypothetical protein